MAENNRNKLQNTEDLEKEQTYKIEKRVFLIEPIFKEEGHNTLGSALMRLMKSESEKI